MSDFASTVEYLKQEAAHRAEQVEENWETLCNYFLLAGSRDVAGKLTRYRPRAIGVETMVRDDLLVVESRGQARVGVLLAEAFLLWSQDIHEPGDQASLDGALTHAEAVVLVAQHDGVRPAARATGIDKSAIMRALKKEAA